MNPKIRAFIILLFIGFGCQPPPDLPPFEITVTVLPNSTSVQLDWTIVNDPRIGDVRYDLYLSNTLINGNINGNTYTINNLQYNTLYTGQLVGKTLRGDTESRDFSFTTGKEYISIPDAGFETALIDAGIDTELIQDGRMIKEDTKGVKSISANSYSIANLEGIQYFTDLEVLNASQNSISLVNLGSNVNLIKLDLSKNNITNLNLSSNTKINQLTVFSNQLNQLNITQCVDLEVLVADHNRLSALDLTRCTLLKTLGLGFNLFTQINLSANTKLTDLDMEANSLNSITLTPFVNMFNLNLKANNLSSLNISTNTNINFLNLQNNRLSSVNLASNLLLKALDVSNNRLTSLSVKPHSQLISLNTVNNPNLGQICVADVPAALDNFDFEKDVFTQYVSNCN
ncbi:hypothetical protein EGI22_18580 [Lacihabitans sp. LS3-19]|uniref:leucine-rich repeat domain-containing protein n=1 Tax=Lacihabitans sp. LS3-19 TaxID=2487335 RepID=UPI0020CF62AC|nr:hypothetical protein [Lacihabitans sp. LS3-19]MCP9769914.1 hypothetical protein [Lacihabitans sp. LS3-19]